MTQDEFNTFLQDVITNIQTVLQQKGIEYASADRLSNFKEAGTLQNCYPEIALRGMLSKHIISIYDMLKGFDTETHYLYTVWQEKIIDAVNYLILLLALLKEDYPS